jgi:hypothetical protein
MGKFDAKEWNTVIKKFSETKAALDANGLSADVLVALQKATPPKSSDRASHIDTIAARPETIEIERTVKEIAGRGEKQLAELIEQKDTLVRLCELKDKEIADAKKEAEESRKRNRISLFISIASLAIAIIAIFIPIFVK